MRAWLGGLRSLAGRPRGGARSFMRDADRELFLSACRNPAPVVYPHCRVDRLCWALCFRVLDVDRPQPDCTYSQGQSPRPAGEGGWAGSGL